MTIKDVAQETHLDWKTVKELDKQYMQEQLRRIGTPGERFGVLDEGLVSRNRRAIREMIDTEPEIRKWFQGSRQAKYLSQDLTLGFASLEWASGRKPDCAYARATL
jgi:transposase